MIFFESLLVAISTYTAVPVPQFPWNERNMRYAMCFFPAAGVLCGLALLLWYQLSLFLGASPVLFAAGAVGVPLLLTGGIHMDGYMDMTDALASHQSRERKLEILKDSHCGAFAVVYCGAYLLMQFALFYELYGKGSMVSIGLIFVLSRACSAFCAVTLPNARKAGMLNAYTEENRGRKICAVTMVALWALLIPLLLWLAPKVGLGILAGAALTVLCYRSMVMRQLGGVTGDTAGFFLQLCELVCLMGAWIGGCV